MHNQFRVFLYNKKNQCFLFFLKQSKGKTFYGIRLVLSAVHSRWKIERSSINSTGKWNKAVFVSPEGKIVTSSLDTENLVLTLCMAQSEVVTVYTSSMRL